MLTYLSFLYFSMGAVLMLFGTILLFKKKVLAINFLLVSTIIVGFATMNQAVISSGLILLFPHTYRIAFPFQFLYGPLYYLLIVYLVIPFRKFRWYDLLHFLPFLVHLIDFIPFYILDAQTKRELIIKDQMVSLTSMPAIVYLYFKMISYVLYIMSGVLVWLGRQKLYVSTSFARNRLIFRWIKADFFMRMIALLSLFLNTFWLRKGVSLGIPNFLYNLDHFGNLMVLVFVPSVLKGLRPFHVAIHAENQPSFLISKGSNAPSSNARISRQHNKILSKFLKLLVDKQIFLDSELALQKLAVQLHVRADVLEELLKEYWRFSFEECLVIFRLKYMNQQIRHNVEWADFSIDQVTSLSGFRSRISFFAAYESYAELCKKYADLDSVDTIMKRFPNLIRVSN